MAKNLIVYTLFVEEATAISNRTDKGCLHDARRRQHIRTMMVSEDEGRVTTTMEQEQTSMEGRATTTTTAKSNSKQVISQILTTKAMIGTNVIDEGSDSSIILCTADEGGQSMVKNKVTQYYDGLVTDLKSAQAGSDAYLSGVIKEEKEKKAGITTPGNGVECF